MTDRRTAPAGDLSARLNQLEEIVTHLERSLLSLDEAGRDLHRRLDTLERELAGLAARVGREHRAGPEVGSPEDERPPHY